MCFTLHYITLFRLPWWGHSQNQDDPHQAGEGQTVAVEEGRNAEGTSKVTLSFPRPPSPTVVQARSSTSHLQSAVILRIRPDPGGIGRIVKFSECELSTVFWRFQCLWVPGDWTEENSMPSVQSFRYELPPLKIRSPNFSFNHRSSYRKLLEDLILSQTGRSATDVIMSDRYAGLRPSGTRCMSTQSL